MKAFPKVVDYWLNNDSSHHDTGVSLPNGTLPRQCRISVRDLLMPSSSIVNGRVTPRHLA